MVCEKRGALVQPIRVLLLHRRRDRGVHACAALRELGAVRHLLRQRVGERVLGLGEERRGMQELRRHERTQRRGEVGLGQDGHAAEEALAELLPDDRGGL